MKKLTIDELMQKMEPKNFLDVIRNLLDTYCIKYTHEVSPNKELIAAKINNTNLDVAIVDNIITLRTRESYNDNNRKHSNTEVYQYDLNTGSMASIFNYILNFILCNTNSNVSLDFSKIISNNLIKNSTSKNDYRIKELEEGIEKLQCKLTDEEFLAVIADNVEYVNAYHKGLKDVESLELILESFKKAIDNKRNTIANEINKLETAINKKEHSILKLKEQLKALKGELQKYE